MAIYGDINCKGLAKVKPSVDIVFGNELESMSLLLTLKLLFLSIKDMYLRYDESCTNDVKPSIIACITIYSRVDFRKNGDSFQHVVYTSAESSAILL